VETLAQHRGQDLDHGGMRHHVDVRERRHEGQLHLDVLRAVGRLHPPAAGRCLLGRQQLVVVGAEGGDAGGIVDVRDDHHARIAEGTQHAVAGCVVQW
jgi:hypothetical protein